MDTQALEQLKALHEAEEARQRRAAGKIKAAFTKAWVATVTPESTISEQMEFIKEAVRVAPGCIVGNQVFIGWAKRDDVRLYLAALKVA